MVKYRIDMTPSARVLIIQVSQGDTGARQFQFVPVFDNSVYELTTETVTFTMQGDIEHQCTVTDGTAVLDCYADMTATAGLFRCKLHFEETTGAVLESAAFYMKVEVAP